MRTTVDRLRFERGLLRAAFCRRFMGVTNGCDLIQTCAHNNLNVEWMRQFVVEQYKLHQERIFELAFEGMKSKYGHVSKLPLP